MYWQICQPTNVFYEGARQAAGLSRSIFPCAGRSGAACSQSPAPRAQKGYLRISLARSASRRPASSAAIGAVPHVSFASRRQCRPSHPSLLPCHRSWLNARKCHEDCMKADCRAQVDATRNCWAQPHETVFDRSCVAMSDAVAAQRTGKTGFARANVGS